MGGTLPKPGEARRHGGGGASSLPLAAWHRPQLQSREAHNQCAALAGRPGRRDRRPGRRGGNPPPPSLLRQQQGQGCCTQRWYAARAGRDPAGRDLALSFLVAGRDPAERGPSSPSGCSAQADSIRVAKSGHALAVRGPSRAWPGRERSCPSLWLLGTADSVMAATQASAVCGPSRARPGQCRRGTPQFL